MAYVVLFKYTIGAIPDVNGHDLATLRKIKDEDLKQLHTLIVQEDRRWDRKMEPVGIISR